MMFFPPVQRGFRAILPLVSDAVAKARSSCVEPALRRYRVGRDVAGLSDRTLAELGISRTVSLHVSRPQRHLRVTQ